MKSLNPVTKPVTSDNVYTVNLSKSCCHNGALCSMEAFDLWRHPGTERPCSGNPEITVEGSGHGLGFVTGDQWEH